MSFDDIVQADPQGHSASRHDPAAAASPFLPLHENTLTNLRNLSTACSRITDLTSLLGTKKDTLEIREKLQTTIGAARDIARATSKDVQTLLQLSGRDRARRQMTLRVEDELERGLKRLKALSETAATKERSAKLPKSTNNGVQMVPLARTDYNEQNEEKELLMQQQKAQKLGEFQLMEDERELQHALIVERDAQVQEIETTVLEVNDMFGQLSRAVADQSEIVTHISINIDTTAEHTKQAVVELQGAAAEQRKARTRSCCLFFILACVAGAAVIAAYVSVKILIL